MHKMMADKGLCKAIKLPVNVLPESCGTSKPIIKHVRRTRANYVPRIYKKSDDGNVDKGNVASNKTGRCLCSNIATPSTVLQGKAPKRLPVKKETSGSCLDNSGKNATNSTTASRMAKRACGRSRKHTKIPEHKSSIKHSESTVNPVACKRNEKGLFISTNVSKKTTSIPVENIGANIARRKSPRNAEKGYQNSLPNTNRTWDNSSKEVHVSFSSFQKETKSISPDKNKNASQRHPSGSTSQESYTSQENQCKICLKSFKSLGSLQCHERCYEKGRIVYKCTTCGKEFGYLPHLKEHAQSEHDLTKIRRDKARVRKYTCLVCKKFFYKKLDFTSHKKVEHALKSVDSHDILHQAKQCKCGTCRQDFATKRILMLHEKLCCKGTPFKCPLCKNSFATKDLMKSHHNQMHREGKGHRCNKCGALFTSEVILNRHSCKSIMKAEAVQSKDIETLKCDSRGKSSRYELRSSLHKNPEQPERSSPYDLRSRSTNELRSSTSVSPYKRSKSSKSISSASQLLRPFQACAQHSNKDSTVVSSNSQWVRSFVVNGTQSLSASACTPHDQPLTSTGSSGKKRRPNTLHQSCTCSTFGKEFVYKNGTLSYVPVECSLHSKSSGIEQSLSGNSQALKTVPTLKCKHCDEEFSLSSQERLEEHELLHEIEATQPTGMTYVCFECGEEFALANELMEHLTDKH